MSKTFSESDVSAHNSATDLYIIVDGDVYDLTKFQDDHPGGKKILTRVAGKDASKQFWKYHNEAILKKYKPKLQVGSLDSKPKAAEPEPAAAPKMEAEPDRAHAAPMPVEKGDPTEPLDAFGDLVPFADPSWYQSYVSPYYNQSHADLRAEVREWVEAEIFPNIDQWEEEKRIPETIYQEIGKRGWLGACIMTLLEDREQYIKYPLKSVHPDSYDYYHTIIITDELARCGSGGFVWNVLGGFGIGCPPVAMYALEDVKKRILPGILAGEKRICLAITEPDGGSDVASLKCEAKLTDDKKHYIVNGEKKWITNGIWADYFTTAVRTGDAGSGMGGISVLLIEREHGGVSTRKMNCQGVWSSGTTYVTFEDTKVPVENLLGKHDKGFQVIMSNFNHERMGIVIQALRFSRVCYEDALKYSKKRETFGKKLYDHPVIRLKLAHMARQIEASWNWLENLVFQATALDETEAMLKLGGAIAGLKAQSTVTFEFCAREASQIFGGLSYTRGGQAARVERLYRDVRAYAIPGGSEEIMLDLSIRQSVKVHQLMGAKF